MKDDAFFSTASDLAQVVKKIEFTVRPWMAKGVVTLIVSSPGMGKTNILLDVARRILDPALNWFDGQSLQSSEDSKIVWCDTEAFQAVLLQRIDTLKMPKDRIILPFADPLQEVQLDRREDIAHLESVIAVVRPAFVALDSLRGSHKGEENDSRMQEVLHAVSKLAQTYNFNCLMTHHTNKPALGMPDIISDVNRIRGSSAIAAQCRTVWALDQPDPTSSFLRLHMIKNNIGPKASPVGVKMTATGAEWNPDAPTQTREPTKQDDAAEFLRNALKRGPRPMREIEREADLEGIAKMTLRRAADRIGILRQGPSKTKDYWTWALPSRRRRGFLTTDAIFLERLLLEHLEHLWSGVQVFRDDQEFR